MAVEKAKERLKAEGLYCVFMTSDISILSYKNDTFDAVIDVESIYANNFKKAGEILKEINRVLKQGGLLFSLHFADDQYIGNR